LQSNPNPDKSWGPHEGLLFTTLFGGAVAGAPGAVPLGWPGKPDSGSDEDWFATSLSLQEVITSTNIVSASKLA
jgi:hypothetical protein